MTQFRIEEYTPPRSAEWDAFVGESRNSTFLFNRGYMDYHSDRFVDSSLMVFKGGRLMALLPANVTDTQYEGRVLHTHSGLTYGGFILPPAHLDASDMLDVFDTLLEYSRAHGITGIDYKPIPHIYPNMPSDEDRYALFRHGAILTECNISAAIDMRNRAPFNQLQRRNLKKGLKGGFSITEDEDSTDFYTLLAECLKERHDVSPVHTSEELKLLQTRFPENIKIFRVTRGEVSQAGVCLYISGNVVHAQYICSSAEGRAEGALTLLFYHLIEEFSGKCRYFDFGISNEAHGQILNEGLFRQKFSLGGRGVAYERYFIKV